MNHALKRLGVSWAWVGALALAACTGGPSTDGDLGRNAGGKADDLADGGDGDAGGPSLLSETFFVPTVDPLTGTPFGPVLDTSGEWLAFGSRDGSNRVLVVRLDGDTFTDAQVLGEDAPAGSGFGFTVALDGNVLAVGAPWEDSLGGDAPVARGALYVYRRGPSGWVKGERLTPSETSTGALGAALDLRAGVLVAGMAARDAALVPAGVTFTPGNTVQVFREDGGAFALESVFQPRTTPTNTAYGASVATNGSRIVVGAPFDSASGSGTDAKPSTSTFASSHYGAVWVYRHDGVGWSTEAFLKPATADYKSLFGDAVALSEAGDVLVGGSPLAGSSDAGLASTFIFTEGGWKPEATLAPPVGTLVKQFGAALQFDGERLLVGAPATVASGAPTRGQAFVYDHDDLTWEVTAVLSPSTQPLLDVFAKGLGWVGGVPVIYGAKYVNGGLTLGTYVFE